MATYESAVEWFEMWGHKYESLLRNTFLQTSHWGLQSLVQHYGAFEFYDDSINPLNPHVLSAHAKTPRLWFEYVYDIDRNKPLTAEQLHARAYARLSKVEKKLIAARNAVLQAKSLLA